MATYDIKNIKFMYYPSDGGPMTITKDLRKFWNDYYTELYNRYMNVYNTYNTIKSRLEHIKEIINQY